MKAFAMLAIGFAALALMRRQSAAARHWVLAVAIACAAAVPALQVVVPSWRLPIRSEPTATAHPSPAATVTMAPPQDDRAVDVAVPRSTARRSLAARVLPWLTRIQWAGAAFGVLVLIVGLARLEWIASQAVPVTSKRLQRIWIQLLNELAIAAPVQLRQTDHAPLLMTWGAFHPIVLLPRGADGWSDARLRAVLCHELAHVRRGDWLALMMVELLRAIDWSNPLTWLAARRLRFESELACDDEVLATGMPAPDYAAHLLAVVRLTRPQHGRPALAASAMARPSGIQRRVEAMLNVGRTRVPVSRPVRLVITATLLFTAILIAGYGASAQSLASLAGVVYDPQNLGIPRTTVSLTNPQTAERREVRSDATGRFEFVGLTPGDYRVEVRAAGFAPLTRAVSIIGRHVDQDLTLSLGSVNESIVLAYAPQSDPAPTPKRASAGADRQPAACAASTVGGNIQPPLKLLNVPPTYPAGESPEQGSVVIDARIGADGTVVSAIAREPVSAGLARSAVAAVNQWRFSPTLLNCVPVEVGMTVNVRFQLQ